MPSVAVPRGAAPGSWARIQDLILPIGMIASVLVIMVPVPAELMDLLLAANITIAVIMLLTTLYVRTPLEFNIFPSLLLATTLFRLVLNVATTRLILTRAGIDGPLAAGGVVRTFGKFVTGGAAGTDNIVVGLIIFSIIVVIQFVVITKGATRISEVAARFTLDGMPGRQMAIDADLERRHDRPARGPASPAGDHAAGRLLRRHGRRQQVRPRRRHRGHHHHSDQYRRRIVHRHRPGGNEPQRRRQALHHADHRRRTGHPGSRLPHFAGGRHVGHPEQPGEQSAEGVFAAAFFAAAGAGHCGRISGPVDLHQPAADSAVSDRRRLRGHGRDAFAPREQGPSGGRGEKTGRGRQERPARRRLSHHRADGAGVGPRFDSGGRSASAAATCWSASSASGKTWPPRWA